ncbi:MAG TPA: O-antigen translocase [Rhizobiaceae bacterium]
MGLEAGGSHSRILRSTAVMGGASVANVALSVVRSKAIAVLLGPQGVGLMGLYNSIADLAQALGALGIHEAGVRQVAEAAGEGDEDRIARTARVLRWASLALGMLGAGLLVALSVPVAHLTFGDGQHAAGVALLSAAVFFRLLAGGQGALLQGMRRIGDLARISVVGSLFGTLVSIPMVYLLGEDGIVPSLVAMAAFSFLVSWWYARGIGTGLRDLSRTAIGVEATALLRLGLAFMASTLLSVASAYAVRIIVMAHEGAAGAGFYQAAWALGGIYAGFILQAMGTDFYPRLTAAAGDNTACNRLVNEQAHVGLLLAGPGVIATLVLAPLVVRIFYTPEFYPAADLLRWICLGMMLRIVAWPMGFIVIAKGARMTFICTELAASAVHVGLAWMFVGEFGAVGAGAAFLALYVWHAILIYLVVRRMSGFRWSSANVRLMLAFLPACCAVFAGFFLLPAWQANALGLVVAASGGIYSLSALLTLVPAESLPRAVRRWLPVTNPGA